LLLELFTSFHFLRYSAVAQRQIDYATVEFLEVAMKIIPGECLPIPKRAV